MSDAESCQNEVSQLTVHMNSAVGVFIDGLHDFDKVFLDVVTFACTSQRTSCLITSKFILIEDYKVLRGIFQRWFSS